MIRDDPTEFVCPITLDVMIEPAMAADGYSYERSEITAWLEKHSTSPLTGLPLANRVVKPNHELRRAIEAWAAVEESDARPAVADGGTLGSDLEAEAKANSPAKILNMNLGKKKTEERAEVIVISTFIEFKRRF